MDLIIAMADESIGWLDQLNAAGSPLPFMIDSAPGATHAPHHLTPTWIDKSSDMQPFDEGFHAVREKTFENQKTLGVIPPASWLPDWPDGLPETIACNDTWGDSATNPHYSIDWASTRDTSFKWIKQIASEGGRFFDWGLYLVKGRPTLVCDLPGLSRTKWKGQKRDAGKHALEFDFKYVGF